MSGAGGSSSDGGSGASGSNKAAFTGNAAYSGSTKPSAPPGGGATSLGSGRDHSIDTSPQNDRIQRISSGQEPGYRAQDSRPFGLSKEEAYRQGKITVDQRDADPVLTAPEERDLTRDLTFAEHWNLAPDALKFSPTLRLLWATGANLGEWSKRQGANVWDWGTGESNISPAPDRGDGQGATGTVSAAQSNYITSGQTSPSNSVAANWYQSLGTGSASGNSGAFNLASEYAAAQQKVKQTLGTPSAVGMLAVNDSPFFDFLQKHNLTKGIL